jgi:hypothetical protein
MNGNYEWFPRPPSKRERVVAGLFTLALLTASASAYGEWRLFGGYDKQVMGGLTIVGLILFLRFMPTVRRR